MIKHVLFVKLIDNSEAACKEAIELFKSMTNKIPFIKQLQVGVDFLHSERSYDIILELTLESREALKEYQCHPYHLEYIKPYMHSHRSASATVDYEIFE